MAQHRSSCWLMTDQPGNPVNGLRVCTCGADRAPAPGERAVVVPEDHAAALAVVTEWTEQCLGLGSRVSTGAQLELVGMVVAAIADGRGRERERITTDLLDGRGTHDCPGCDCTGLLRDGRPCPLCAKWGYL